MSQRTTRSSNNKKKETSRSVTATTLDADVDCSKLSTKEILDYISANNNDPMIGRMVQTLAARIPDQIADGVEADRRARSVVVSGLPELNESRPSLRQTLDEKKVSEILDALGVQCRPTYVHRLGRYDESRPRLLKILLPSRSHCSSVLAYSYKLRSCGFQNIYVRRSMTSAERQRELELRQEARARNKDVGSKQWIVYRGELKNVSEIPSFSQNSRKSENL